jgi:hypothetical protein
VFENRVLRRREREEVTGEWRKLHNGNFMICHSSPNVVRVIKYRRIEWAEHVAHEREVRKSWFGSRHEKRRHGKSRSEG